MFVDFSSLFGTINDTFMLFFSAGELRTIEDDQPFNFKVREDDYTYNQKHYEALGDVI